MQKELLYKKSLNAMFSLFIGDAFGLPVECKSPDSIKKLYGYLDSYESNKNHPYKSVAKHPAGSISDDSQLSLALMSSISRKQIYDLNDIKLAHIEAHEGKWGEPIGWGRTTVQAIEHMKQNLPITAIPTGAGNGPVIKIAPIAIYCIFRAIQTPIKRFTNSFNHALLKKCKEISTLTHGDAACIIAAYCHARILIRAIQNEIPSTSQQIAQLIINDAEYAQNKLNAPNTFTERLKSILLHTNGINVFDMNTGYVSKMICNSQSSWIYNSYPLTAYCIAKYLPYKNFKYALTETANAGGDADSNASMVATVVGATLSWNDIPEDLVKRLLGWRFLLQEVNKFLSNL